MSPPLGLQSKDEFVAFLLIYVSHADLDFSEDERKNILQIVNKDTFTKVDKLYNSLGEYKRLEMIINNKDIFYPSSDQKSKLMDLITHQFMADGEVSKLENNLYQFLERLL